MWNFFQPKRIFIMFEKSGRHVQLFRVPTKHMNNAVASRRTRTPTHTPTHMNTEEHTLKEVNDTRENQFYILWDNFLLQNSLTQKGIEKPSETEGFVNCLTVLWVWRGRGVVCGCVYCQCFCPCRIPFS